MKDAIKDRAAAIGAHIVQTKATVRETATVFNVSKSTVHKDVTERLKYIHPRLARQAAKVLKYNKEQRHIRGGQATCEKYKEQRERKKAMDACENHHKLPDKKHKARYMQARSPDMLTKKQYSKAKTAPEKSLSTPKNYKTILPFHHN